MMLWYAKVIWYFDSKKEVDEVFFTCGGTYGEAMEYVCHEFGEEIIAKVSLYGFDRNCLDIKEFNEFLAEARED